MIESHLKEILTARKMSQVELSRRTGIRQTTISKMCLRQDAHLPYNVLDRVCAELDCQPGDILTYTPNKEEGTE